MSRHGRAMHRAIRRQRARLKGRATTREVRYYLGLPLRAALRRCATGEAE